MSSRILEKSQIIFSAAFIGLAFLSSSSFAETTSDIDDRRAKCTQWMVNGYPSGLLEKSCQSDFNLPSPFLFTCAKAQSNGFDTETQRKACILFFANAANAAKSGIVRK